MSARMRLFPVPGTSLLLSAFWLLLVDELSLAQVALAALLGLAVPPLTARTGALSARVRRIDAALGLAAVFCWDMLVANLEVAALVLGQRRRLAPALFWVPLDIDQPGAVALLAAVVTLTPGTVSVEVSASHRTLLVHALRVSDPDAAAAQIKRRYEARIKAVFGC